MSSGTIAPLAARRLIPLAGANSTLPWLLALDNRIQSALRLIVGRLEDFKSRVADGLDSLDRSARRDIIRTLVRRIELDQEKVNIVFMIAPLPLDSGSQGRLFARFSKAYKPSNLRLAPTFYHSPYLATVAWTT